MPIRETHWTYIVEWGVYQCEKCLTTYQLDEAVRREKYKFCPRCGLWIHKVVNVDREKGLT
jgi:transcription initiation factor IIE alpha subunit